jgi:hypothetical protein
MIDVSFRRLTGGALLVLALILATAIYWPGLYGSWLFDDYPNIVDNHGVQPAMASLASLVRAALSSPSSEFKRPLASLTFAANYLAVGLAPFWWKLTNLLVHLFNGLLVFALARALLDAAAAPSGEASGAMSDPANRRHAGIVAALVAAGWMLLPINLTGVLYVVQRMESMANLFVLLGLIGYVAGRRRMLAAKPGEENAERRRVSSEAAGFILCCVSITLPVAVGLLAKETAVMLPLYALAVEWALFRGRRSGQPRCDWRIAGLFALVLVLPIIVGLAWLAPGLLKPQAWATRDFTLGTRLLSEARIVVDYIGWTLLPTPEALSFYHDDFRISTGLLSPWTTGSSMLLLVALLGLMAWLRPRRPLAALGIALFLGCQLLTGTVLPLELIYEHRNYFASFGLLLTVVPLLAAPAIDRQPKESALPFAMPRHVLLAGLLLGWTVLTAATAYAWGNPLRLAEELAARAPQSPRAQYELGRTYIIYSHYDPTSPFTQKAYAPLEKSAALPDSSILPEQALIFMNAHMHLPQKDTWWDSLIAKLKARKAGVQDESSLAALSQCARERRCDLPRQRMTAAFAAGLSHPDPGARLYATYGDYAWNVLGDHALGERMTEAAVKDHPNEPAYQITLVRMLAAQGKKIEAQQALMRLESLNFGGRLDNSLPALRMLVTDS